MDLQAIAVIRGKPCWKCQIINGLTGIKAAAEACMLAGRPDLIAHAIDVAWFDGRAAATAWLAERVASERAESEPASASSTHRRASAAATDALAEVAKQRKGIS